MAGDRHLHTDLHCHSTYSDGRASLPDLVAYTQRIGFTLAVTDHYSIDQKMNNPERLAEYIAALEQYPVYRAVEIDLGEELTIPTELRDHLDYLIGSMHNVTRAPGQRYRLPNTSPAAKEEYMEYYVEALVDGIHNAGIAFVGHPTFLVGLMSTMQQSEHDALWTEPRRARVIEAAVATGVAFEISSRYNVPSPAFMRDALDAGARFAVGSDSHWLDRTANIPLPLRYVQEYTIPAERFFLPQRIIATNE